VNVGDVAGRGGGVCAGAGLNCGACALEPPESPSGEDCGNGEDDEVDEGDEGDEGDEVEDGDGGAADAFDSDCAFASACAFDSVRGAGSALGCSVRGGSWPPNSDHNSPASSGVYETVLRGPLGVPPPGSRGAPLTSDSYIGSVTEPSGEVFAAGGVTCVTSPNEGDVDACGSRARGTGSFGVDEENADEGNADEGDADEGDADEGDADEGDAGAGSASEAVSVSGSRGGP
jgi:hypothetical protein